MTKLSKRLLDVVSFASSSDSIVDIGCDHGLTTIYIYENKLCKKIVCSDINPNALANAKENIQKRNLPIEAILSDGIKNIDLELFNTLIISGMGTYTILNILEDKNKLQKINKLIIQSNNDYELLRKELNNRGYYLEEEKYTIDKSKWYITMKFIKTNKKNNNQIIKYGYLNNKEYNSFLIDNKKSILKKIPITNIKTKFKTYQEYKKLKKAIKQS